jgi:tripartite-type tricarboxylate transporter receptor subunit TctC
MASSFAIRAAVAAIVLAAAVTHPARSQAQDWPTKPIRIVVGFGPGGGTDIVARILAPPLSEVLGQPVVIENKPGAGGTVGADLVAKSPNDGYTALLMNSAQPVSGVMLKSLPFDAIKDFQPVGLFASASLVVVASKDFPAKDIKGFVALAKAEPGKFSFASLGIGSAQHFAGELFRQISGIDIKHVPAEGTLQAIAAVRGNQTQVLFELVQTVLAPIKAGDLKPLGITAAVRWPTLPEVQTLQEQGVPGYDVTSWYGLAFPAGTPAPIVEKMNKAIYSVASRTAVRKAIADAGPIINVSSSEDFGNFLAGEISKWGAVRDKAGIKAQ